MSSSKPVTKPSVVQPQQSECGPIQVESKRNTETVQKVNKVPLPIVSRCSGPSNIYPDEFAVLARVNGFIPKNVEKEASASSSATQISECLRYVYTSGNKDLEMEAANLFLLEDYEDTPGEHFRTEALIRTCKEWILKGVTKNNVLARYHSGKQMRSGIIADTCFEFMEENKGEIWRTRDTFQDACDAYPDLMYELFMN